MRISLVLLLLFAGCSQQPSLTERTDLEAQSVEEPPAPISEAKREEFIAPDGTFSIRFPTEPTVTEDPPNLAIGKTGGATNSSMIGSEEFRVKYSEFNQTPSDPGEELKFVTEYMIRTLEAKLIWIRDITVNDHLGNEILMENADGLFIQRKMVLVGNGAYQISVGSSSKEKLLEVAEEFTGSFRLLEK